MGFELFYEDAGELSVRIDGTQAPGGAARAPEGEIRGKELEIVDRVKGTRWSAGADREIRFLISPSHTVSKSPSGLERIFQGLSILAVADGSGQEGHQEMTLNVEVASIAGA